MSKGLRGQGQWFMGKVHFLANAELLKRFKFYAKRCMLWILQNYGRCSVANPAEGYRLVRL